MSKTFRTDTEAPRLRARTTTTELIERGSDLLNREFLSTADAHTLRRTLRLIEGRTGIASSDFVAEMAA